MIFFNKRKKIEHYNPKSYGSRVYRIAFSFVMTHYVINLGKKKVLLLVFWKSW